MLVGCGEHARAICRISVVKLRRVAPPAFTLLMVVSLLLADGLLPVLAAKYRSEAALYINSNTARSNAPGAGGGGGGGAIQGRSSSKIHTMNNNHFRTKIRVKSFVSKSGDSFVVGEGGGGYSKPTRPQVRVHNTGGRGRANGGEEEIDKKSLPSYDTPSRDEPNHLHIAPSTPPSASSYSSAVSSSSPPSSSSSSSSSSRPPSSPRLPLKCPLDCSSTRRGSLSKDAGSGTCPGNDLVFRCASCGMDDVFKDVCPVLTPALADDVCRCEAPERALALEKVRLPFCSTFSVASVTCAGAQNCSARDANGTLCRADLQAVIDIDDQVRRDYEGFEDLISRYDCRSKYSVKWECDMCKCAYRDWLCSQKLPFFHSGKQWSPCVEFCTNVEEMCPFFRPKIETHAGDPSFICKDHQMNLPNTASNKNCYGLCHLRSPAEIAEANCSHAQRSDMYCSLLKDCNSTEALGLSDSISDSTNTNSSSRNINLTSTSGASPRRTYMSSLLPYMTLVYSLGLSLTLTQFLYLTIGLT